MGKIYAVANQKGGVGKSTTVVNLAAYLGSRDYTVLCIDIDAQGNTTTGFGIKKKSIEYSTYDILIGQARIQEAIRRTEFKNVSIVPATSALAGGEVEMISIDDRMNRLKMQLLTCRLDYDYIIIDTPPSMGFFTISALIAADSVLIPCRANRFTAEGLSELWENIKTVRRVYKHPLKVEGLLINCTDPRTNIAKQLIPHFEKTAKEMDSKVYKSMIRRDIKLEESQLVQEDILSFSPNSHAVEDYTAAVNEFLGE